LFTTRIGLGAFEFPVPLRPLNKKDASAYFRAIARVFSVTDLASLPSLSVYDYCSKLHYNTLFIKWFMHSVSVGKRPTMLISSPAKFLQFCLQNVFNSLSADVKIVAKILANLSGQQTVASLAFYSGLDSLSIQSALSILITSNLVAPQRGRNTEDEDRYDLSSLARAYIHKFMRMDLDEQRRLIMKQNELRSAQEEMSARAGVDIFDMNYVFVRDKEDYIVAKILTGAVNKI
jgi:LuxR family transcriptional regulator, glucitol operon activator